MEFAVDGFLANSGGKAECDEAVRDVLCAAASNGRLHHHQRAQWRPRSQTDQCV